MRRTPAQIAGLVAACLVATLVMARPAAADAREVAERAHREAVALRRRWQEAERKDAALWAQAVRAYDVAIRKYRVWVAGNPLHKDVVEIRYQIGEAYYFSERYLASVPEYEWVRDHGGPRGPRFLDAVGSIVAAYEREMEREVEAGRLPAITAPPEEMLRSLRWPWRPREIPTLYRALQRTWDGYRPYASRMSAPRQALNAALISLMYLHVDEAVARLDGVIARHCHSQSATQALDALVTVFTVAGRFDEVARVKARFARGGCGEP